VFDFYDRPRPYDTLFDIGAAEYNPSFLDIPEYPLLSRSSRNPFPNPAINYLLIPFFNPLVSDVYLDIAGTDGKIVIQKKYILHPAGESTSIVDVKSLKKGTYIYHIFNSQIRITGQFTKLEEK
jgi:hypothetical protein